MFNFGVTVNEISSPGKQDQRTVSRKGRSHGMNFNDVQIILFYYGGQSHVMVWGYKYWDFFRRGKIAFYNKIYGKHIWFNALKEFYTSELPAKNVRFQVRTHWQLSSREKYVSSNHFYNTEVNI